VALAAIKGDRTLAELAEQFDVQAYLRAYGSVSKARTSRGRYLDFYSGCRPHSTLDRIKLTSPRCPSAWRPNHGSRFTYPKLFRQPGPPHRACSRLRMAPYAAMARARNANSSPIPKIVRRLTTITRAPILAHAKMIALSRSDKWQLATCALLRWS
jgi:hypothetical protein